MALSQTSSCPYPQQWHFITYIRYSLYVLRETAINQDYRILIDSTFKCWANYEFNPETYPVRSDVYAAIFEARKRHDMDQVKRIQDKLVYCWPLRPTLPKFPAWKNTY